MDEHKTARFESTFRMTVVALIAVCVLLGEIVSIALAEAQASKGSPRIKQSSVATKERIILHGVRFRTLGNKIDKSSLAILDTAVRIIKENPNSLIYIAGRCCAHDEDRNLGSKRIHQQTRAVATYFEQKGVSANRLILLAPDGAKYTYRENNAQTSEPILIVVQLDPTRRLD